MAGRSEPESPRFCSQLGTFPESHLAPSLLSGSGFVVTPTAVGPSVQQPHFLAPGPSVQQPVAWPPAPPKSPSVNGHTFPPPAFLNDILFRAWNE